MSDDSPRIIFTEITSPAAPGAQLLSTPKELRELKDEELEKMIDALLLSAEAGTGDNAVIIARVQYYMQELARREQVRQTKVMIEQTEMVKDYTVRISNMTIMVALLSFVIMATALWPLVHAHCPQ